jgi:hypothetical protein
MRYWWTEPWGRSRLYQRDQVEALMPAVWDDGYAYGMTDPHAPDPDMPRGSRVVSRGTSLPAQIADVRQAWKRADLTLKQRRALFMRHALGHSEEVIGLHEGVHKSSISRRMSNGVGRILEFLNGETLIDDDEDE